jgi:parallel beta-helix repeat protein
MLAVGGWARPSRAQHRRAAPSHRVELLEDRTLLNSYLVDLVTDVDNGGANPTAGTVSLRKAIRLANTNSGADDIQFDASLAGRTITLGCTELPAITDTVQISGPAGNPVTIDANNASRIFEIGAGKAATISYLTMTHGKATSGGGVYNAGTVTLDHVQLTTNTAGGYGGGLYNAASSTATINQCTLSGNTAYLWSGGAVGGGIFSEGTLGVTASTLSGNSANLSSANVGYGGGLEVAGGTAVLTNCTLSGNQARNSGGGMYVGGSTTNVTLNSCTVTANQGYAGAGLYRAAGTLTLNNTIVAGNLIAGSTPDDIAGTVAAGSSYNLIGNAATAGGLTYGDANHNIVGLDPLLGPLQDNGGPTFTHALLRGSPAIDRGANAGVLTDLGGVARPRGLG